jgi:hypothetical protein
MGVVGLSMSGEVDGGNEDGRFRGWVGVRLGCLLCTRFMAMRALFNQGNTISQHVAFKSLSRIFRTEPSRP